VSLDADPCPNQKRRCQIGHPAPDILTGVARRHGPGYIFRFAGWVLAAPGPARAVLGWPAGACWRPQQPKHGIHTPPELWNAFGACGGLAPGGKMSQPVTHQGGGGDFSAAEIATADVVYEIARGQRMRKK
jgi:hypothetical protein